MIEFLMLFVRVLVKLFSLKGSFNDMFLVVQI